MQGYGDKLFRNVHAPFKANPPFVPKEYNPTGAYRKTFTLPASWENDQVFLRLEKVASASFVWVNGQAIGYNEGAQEPAEYNITKYLKPGEKNTLAVRLENLPESSRWYPGAGLYRNVHLIVTEDAYIPVWGTYITTPSVNEKFAKVNVLTKVVLPEGADPAKYSVETSVWNPNKQKLDGCPHFSCPDEIQQ